MKRFIPLAIVAVAGLSLAACSSGAVHTVGRPAAGKAMTAPAPAQPTAAVVGPKVAAIVSSANAALKADEAISGSDPELSAESGTYQGTAEQLQALAYPTKAQASATAVVRDLEKLSADAQALSAATSPLVVTDLAQTYVSDQTSEQADGEALNVALGLPASTT